MRKKKTVSFVIREVEEPLNRAGVNTLCMDPANQVLCTAGRDSVIRVWDTQNSDKGRIQVNTLAVVMSSSNHVIKSSSALEALNLQICSNSGK